MEFCFRIVLSAYRKNKYIKIGLLLILSFSLSGCLLPLSKWEFTLRKFTTELEDFEWEKPAVADDGGNIFFRGTSSDVYRWNYETGLQEIDRFEDFVNDIAVDNDDDALLIAESYKMWRYELDTGDLSLVYTDPENYFIKKLYLVGSHLIVDVHEDQNDYFATKNRLIRLSDFATVYTTDLWETETAACSVYAPSLNKRFLVTDHAGLGYQVIDFEGESLGPFISCTGENWEHGENRLFLRLFPGESKIAISWGDIYTTDIEITFFERFEYSCADLTFYEDRILLLTQEGNGSDPEYSTELIELSMDWDLLSDPVEFDDVRAENLFISDHYLYVLTEDWDETTYITRLDLLEF